VPFVWMSANPAIPVEAIETQRGGYENQ